jgi:hypothetical protein
MARAAGMSAAALGSSAANSINPPVMSMQGAGSLLNRQHQQLLAAQRQTAMLQQQSAMLRAQSPQFRAGLSPPAFNSPGFRTGYQLPVSTSYVSLYSTCSSISSLAKAANSVRSIVGNSSRTSCSNSSSRIFRNSSC